MKGRAWALTDRHTDHYTTELIFRPLTNNRQTDRQQFLTLASETLFISTYFMSWVLITFLCSSVISSSLFLSTWTPSCFKITTRQAWLIDWSHCTLNLSLIYTRPILSIHRCAEPFQHAHRGLTDTSPIFYHLLKRRPHGYRDRVIGQLTLLWPLATHCRYS